MAYALVGDYDNIQTPDPPSPHVLSRLGRKSRSVILCRFRQENGKRVGLDEEADKEELCI
jgi:hypothetical protein